MGTCADAVIRTASMVKSRMKNAMPCAPETRCRNAGVSGKVRYLQLVSYFKCPYVARITLQSLEETKELDLTLSMAAHKRI